jgi:hypothetical protein
MLAAVLTLCTEIFSKAKLISNPWLVSFWISIVLCICILGIIYRKIFKNGLIHASCVLSLKDIYSEWYQYLYLVYIVLVLLISIVLAWIAPPNTFDSMTYHMSRVMHWQQNQSIDFYPTTILRQLFSSPWSEYAILHLQLLSGTDRFANFVQFFSMVGSLIGVSSIAKELGATGRGQIYAAVLCAAIPMGILQSTSTQTDYVVTFWLVCFVYYCLLLQRKITLINTVGAGLALGLALLTKPTAYIFAMPFALWLGYVQIRQLSIKNITHLALIPILAFIINLGHFYRNYELVGSPLGQATETGQYSYSNEVITPATVVSNVVRNLALHLESGTHYDHLIERVIFHLHKYLGISINDPRISWPDYEFHVQGLMKHEDYAGNLVHLFLLGMTLIVYFAWMQRNLIATRYVVCCLSGFLIFCIYLRWQPWHSRLHLPFFVLASPFIAYVIDWLQGFKISDLVVLKLPTLSAPYPNMAKFASKFQTVKVGDVLMCAVIYWSLPFLYSSSTKPVFGTNSIFTTPRIDQYFVGNSNIKNSYQGAANYLRETNCKYVGLLGFGNDWEYALWVLINTPSQEAIHLEHIEITNASRDTTIGKRNQLEQSKVCAFIVPAWATTNPVKINDTDYYISWVGDALKVYEPRKTNTD